MSEPEDEPEDEPEALQLHAALALAILGLELIAEGAVLTPNGAAATALKILRRKHPVSHQHLSKGKPW